MKLLREPEKLIVAFLLSLFVIASSFFVVACGGYDNGTSTNYNVNGNTNANDNTNDNGDGNY